MDTDRAERLLAHYIGGAWVAPLGTRAAPATAADGARIGTLVLAGPADIARARGAAAAALPGWHNAGCAARARLLSRLRRAAHGGPGPLPAAGLAGAVRPAGGGDPVAILAAPGTAPGRVLRAAHALLAAGTTLVVMPLVPCGAQAHDGFAALHAAGLPAGLANLLPGDARSAALLSAGAGFSQVLRL